MIETKLDITIQDLIIAYRKAKVDLYYSSTYLKKNILEYEENLLTNLENLLIKLNEDNYDWLKDQNYLGDWVPIPTRLCVNNEDEVSSISYNRNTIFSEQNKCWEQVKRENQGVSAEFRIVAKPGMDFQVLASLWIFKVGHKFDVKLSDCSYGNRLRRTSAGEFNQLSMGSFKPYLWQYKSWQDNGINEMNDSLNKGNPIITLTTDIRGFYHHLNPDFIINKEFLLNIGISLNSQEIALTKLFIESINNWTKLTPFQSGLPVGLPASALIANMALIELDRIIEEQILPIYYGRYVDDIILVFKNSSNFKCADDVWQFIIDRSKGMLVKDSKYDYSYIPEYLNGSNICFSVEKTKVFFLTGSSGLSMVRTIRNRLNERSSEWRSIPVVPEDSQSIEAMVVEIHQRNQEIFDSFRKADFLTLNRSEFALLIRDFEAYSRDLDPESWSLQRKAFINAFIDNTLIPSEFFTYERYLSRITALICSCGDFKELFSIINKIGNLVDEVEKYCSIRTKATETSVDSGEVINRWSRRIEEQLEETILSSISLVQLEKQRTLWDLLFPDESLIYNPPPFKTIKGIYWKYFNRDLARTPFRYQYLSSELGVLKGNLEAHEILYCGYDKKLFGNNIIQGLEKIKSNKKDEIKGYPFAFYFSTRPFNITELIQIFGFKDSPDINKALKAFRGYTITDCFPKIDKDNYLIIENTEVKDKIRIALASWESKESYLFSSVKNKPILSLERYSRFNRLINSILKLKTKPDYAIMPELSIPACWFLPTANKLRKNQISFISGVEYVHDLKNKTVANQVWASLLNKGSEIPFEIIYKKDKQKPAVHEEIELYKIADLRLKPEIQMNNPQIIKHGDFCFSIIICSELTNIDYRAYLRGKIDTLFVPEWNQDIDSFNALVESAALDIHAYIIQCNNRKYGDSRIRVPHKDSWKRDAIRIKGGLNDYVVVGEIDIAALRQFQSNHRSPEKPFKPKPDGFEIGKYRDYIHKESQDGENNE